MLLVHLQPNDKCYPTAIHIVGRTSIFSGWLVCSLTGWLSGWLAGWLPAWLAGWRANWQASRHPSRLAGWLVGWLAGRMAGWLPALDMMPPPNYKWHHFALQKPLVWVWFGTTLGGAPPTHLGGGPAVVTPKMSCGDQTHLEGRNVIISHSKNLGIVSACQPLADCLAAPPHGVP